ncbi:MAG TPA: hypothetical protein VF760_05290 [Xanthobacteraceae bacterium]
MALDNQGQLRGMEKSILADYYVVLSRSGDPAVWQWEIHRRSRPLGVRLYGAGFVSQAGARLAGETALQALLREMAIISERDRP